MRTLAVIVACSAMILGPAFADAREPLRELGEPVSGKLALPGPYVLYHGEWRVVVRRAHRGGLRESTISADGTFSFKLPPGRYSIGVWYSIDKQIGGPPTLCGTRHITVRRRTRSFVHISCRLGG